MPTRLLQDGGNGACPRASTPRALTALKVRLAGNSILATLDAVWPANRVDRNSRGVLEDSPMRCRTSPRYEVANNAVPGRLLALRKPHPELFFRESLTTSWARRRRRSLSLSPQFSSALTSTRQAPWVLFFFLSAAAEARGAWGTPLPDGLHRGIALTRPWTPVAAVLRGMRSRPGRGPGTPARIRGRP